MLALAAGLRFFALGAASIQIDEAMSWLSSAGYPDVHPPLFYWMLNGWARLGSGEFWLRTLPVLASLLALFLWARVSRNPLSVLLLATSFAELQQDREVRMYAFLELWAVAHLWALMSTRWWLAGLTLLAACFTHLFGLFLVPLAWFWGCRRLYGVMLLWLMWAVPHYLGQLDHPLGLRQVPTLAMEVEAVGRLVTGRVAAFGDPLSLVAGALGVAWLAWRPVCPAWVYYWALGPWLSLWLVSRFTPIQLFEFKYLVWTLPAWTLLLASSMPLVWFWVGVNLWGAIPWLLWPDQTMADWRGVADRVRPAGLPVVVHPSMMAAPLLFYGLGPPRLQFVDEVGQIPQGPMIWVSTPHHPYVVSQGLLRHLRGLRGRTVFPSRLPSSVVEVSVWEGEKQGR
ncbi:hypothetical protein IV102_03335 [bacterium]|nr:hypothetical protein [bacterium]